MALLRVLAIACVVVDVEAKNLKGQATLIASDGAAVGKSSAKTWFELHDGNKIDGNEAACLMKWGCIFPDVIFDIGPTVDALKSSSDYTYQKKFWETEPSYVDEAGMKAYLQDYVLEAVYQFFNHDPVPTKLVSAHDDVKLQLLGLDDIRLVRVDASGAPICPDPAADANDPNDDVLHKIALYKCCVNPQAARVCEAYEDAAHDVCKTECECNGTPRLPHKFEAVKLSAFVKARRGDCRIHALVGAALLKSLPASAGISKVRYVYAKLHAGFDHAFLTFDYSGKTYSFDARKGMKNFEVTSVDTTANANHANGVIHLKLADGKGGGVNEDGPFDLSPFPKDPNESEPEQAVPQSAAPADSQPAIRRDSMELHRERLHRQQEISGSGSGSGSGVGG